MKKLSRPSSMATCNESVSSSDSCSIDFDGETESGDDLDEDCKYILHHAYKIKISGGGNRTIYMPSTSREVNMIVNNHFPPGTIVIQDPSILDMISGK